MSLIRHCRLKSDFAPLLSWAAAVEIACQDAELERGLERLKPYRGFAGYGIDELLRAATGYCADCDLDDQEFLERLNRRQPSQLPQWQLLHLVGICRHVAGLDVPFQEDLEAALTVAA